MRRRLTCTNIFELQADGSWRIVHHTAAPAPRM
jgi:ketosteroid isomerase-like protein